MSDLFNQVPNNALTYEEQRKQKILNDISLIQGLDYISNFINKSEEEKLIDAINAQQWLTDIKRRVQHYGYKYEYKTRSVDHGMFIGELPNWALAIAKRLYDNNYFDTIPDQLIINEYLPGQGIANHVDCEPCFGETIISIGLGSSCVMDFVNIKTKQKIEVMLETDSLVALSGEARHKWSHGIAARKTDYFNGIKTDRRLRISLTFRKVKFQ